MRSCYSLPFSDNISRHSLNQICFFKFLVVLTLSAICCRKCCVVSALLATWCLNVIDIKCCLASNCQNRCRASLHRGEVRARGQQAPSHCSPFLATPRWGQTPASTHYLQTIVNWLLTVTSVVHIQIFDLAHDFFQDFLASSHLKPDRAGGNQAGRRT